MEGRYRWIMFDADGTLFDYDKAEQAALARAFEDCGSPFDAEMFLEVYRRINGELWSQFEQGRVSQDRLQVQRFELLRRELDLDADPGELSARYIVRLSEGTDLIDHGEEVVRRLAEVSRLLMITNGLSAVQRPRFARSAIHGYLSEIVISEEVGFAKPQAGIFDVAFHRMAQPDKAEVLMVGDKLSSDIRGGSDYGVDTCWFNPDRKDHDGSLEITHEIQDLRELIRIQGRSAQSD